MIDRYRCYRRGHTDAGLRSVPTRVWLILLLLIGIVWPPPADAAPRRDAYRQPVAVIGDSRLIVRGKAGQGVLPLFVSHDWSRALPGVRRAIIILHGRLRDADRYFATVQHAQTAAGPAAANTLLIAPQFPAEIDVAAHHLAPETLRWSLEGWEGGDPALAPAPLSSFEALDAIVARLSDRRLLPDLEEIVIAGHSGGAQVAQRYAVLANPVLNTVRLRFVIANPSSYAYLDADRPVPAVAAACPGYNRWKYGLETRPAYAADRPEATFEPAYIGRDILYLLGAEDTDPNHPALDRSCMAEAQGRYRLARGHAFYDHLRARHPDLAQRLQEVDGVGHQEDAIFSSACGLAALFRSGPCVQQIQPPK